MRDDRLRLAVTRLATDQAGVISRAQALDLGMTRGMIRALLDSGRWQRVHPGTYVIFTGPLPVMTRVWAAIRYAGRGAMVVGATALWLAGAVDEPPPSIQIGVPHGRSVVPVAGVVIVAGRCLGTRPRPAARPPRTAVEDALLTEVGMRTSVDAVVGLVLQVLQRRVTTPQRLRAALGERRRQRWRSLILDLTDEAADGVHSRLEYCYRRDVERRHGLPRGERNVAEAIPARAGSSGSTHRYRDVRYRAQRLVVELDGALTHPAEDAWLDRRRDNDLVITGERTLRYGWREVGGQPCRVADQVGTALQVGGWTGRPQRCSAPCRLPDPPD
ncbi:MAG: type IV toxin-antitoxin system AbiEi family antitoxin domain-containing protein [Kineosporiaceae bacterium]